MYTLYQSDGAIVPELANRNRNPYSKDSTGDHGGVRLKGGSGKNKLFYYCAMSTKEDIVTRVLTRKSYERDNSDSSCNFEFSECSDNDLSECNNFCTLCNSVAPYEKL